MVPLPNEHEGPSESESDHPDLIAAQARVGLVLFGVYLAIYAGFVGLSALSPAWMATRVAGGLNLAIVYGMGLIVAAIVLALGYMAICRGVADRHDEGGRGR